MSIQVENLGREFIKAVNSYLKNGFSALSDLSIILLNVDVDFVTRSDSRFENIRSAILAAQQNLQGAELAASSQLKTVDKFYVELTVKRSNLSVEQQSKSLKLQNLKNQQKTNKSTLDMFKMSLDIAVQNRNTMQQVLWDLERQKQEAEEQMNVGIGITFIPIFGWIAGPLMISAAENDINEANYKASEAAKLVQGFEWQVSKFSWKVSDCGRMIEDTRSEISRTEWELHQIAQNIDDILIQKKVFADFQAKIRNSLSYLGCLVGIANVAELQTRLFVLLQAMIKLLQNLIKLAETVREDRLLYDEGMKSLITNMQVQYIKLQAVTVPSDTAAIEEFI
ncbi:hypothetical protein P4O66_014322 [Electrophorus voltai]|uniref:Uncharacterized protein n=1 Tax=Electrophorus voltai TaxID=2609070 RepID=A0AAD8YZV8_9TELE|nr:hypothetical protein P4O66_014322 [Electrophorus voltai]